MKICTKSPGVPLLVVVLALAVTARPAMLRPGANDHLLEEALQRGAGETTASPDATAKAPQSRQRANPPSPAARASTSAPPLRPAPTWAAPTWAAPTWAAPTWAAPTWGPRPDRDPGSGGGSSSWNWDDDDHSWDVGWVTAGGTDGAFVVVVAVLAVLLLMGVPAYLACARAAEESGVQVEAQPRRDAVRLRTVSGHISQTIPAGRARPRSPARVHSTTRSPVSLMSSSAAA